MTEEREQIIRRGFELWNEGDYESLDELIHPEVKIDATTRVLNPATYHGIEGFRQLTRETFEVWEEWSIEPREFIWNGDTVVVETRIHAIGRGSGIRVGETYYTVWRLEGWVGTAMELHDDREQAFASAGLPPTSDRPGTST